MDENEYRSIYHAINQRRCPFEKTLLSRAHQCECQIKYNIAEREAIGCDNEADQKRCQQLLAILHDKATFAIKSSAFSKTLGHAKEIKIQSGGLIGLSNALINTDGNQASDPINNTVAIEVNIKRLVNDLLVRFKDFESIPYSEVIKAIASFEGRKRRRKK